VTQAITNLARLTLRQLRQMASDLGVTLYSRKSKEALVSAIAEKQERRGGDLKAIEAELNPPARPQTSTRVVFLPRDPQWAYVFWEISDEDRRHAQSEGASHLSLRLADVTGLQGGSSHPHTLQEVPVDSHSTEWYLPVPLCDRDYRVELGYRLRKGGWYSLAFSAVAHVPSLEPSQSVADAFVPFSLEQPVSTAAVQQTSSGGGVPHEHTYQIATATSARTRRIGSEVLHELDRDQMGGLNDSGAGLWASGRSESGSGLVRQRSFWLVADAELIVYGATDPSATLFIGDEQVALSSDGTFRVHVPFRDGQQLYPIRAVAADGEQERSIRLEFERSTPEAHVNTSEEAVAEWF